MSAKKNDSNNIAIIGASGTGKTTLAVGLYATSSPEFTVSPVGEETRKYIEIRQSTIEEGYWPAATNEAENLDLRLRLHAGGKETDIVFREYMGECMEQPNYIQDVIGVPKAAMILFNPGMPDLKSAERRNMLIGNLKVIAQHLKDNQCAAVAFVVTASDRLTSDLAEFRDEFEEYVSEVTNHLGTLGLNWKRYDVTVSGELADQSHPKLARGENNTTHKPFLWLMGRIHARAARIRAVRIAKYSAAIAVVALSIYGTLWVRCTVALSKVEGEMESIVDRLENAHMTKDLAAATTNKNALALLQTDRLGKVLVAGFGNGERKSALGSRIHDANDLWSVRLLDMNLDDIKGKLKKDPALLQPGWAKTFDDILKLANPTDANAVAELGELKDEWNRKRIEMERTWQTAILKKEIEKKAKDLALASGDKIPSCLKEGYTFLKELDRDYPLVTNRTLLAVRLDTARTNALGRYCSFVANWRPEDEKRPIAGPALAQKIKRDLLGKISEKEFKSVSESLLAIHKEACVAWDTFHLPKETKSLVAKLRDAGENPISALQASLSFLNAMTNTFPTVKQDKIIEYRQSIEQAREEAIKKYSDSIEKTWDIKGNTPIEFNCKQILLTVLTEAVVTVAEAKTFEQDMGNRFEDAKQKWDKNQEKLVDGFGFDKEILKVVEEYGNFIAEHSKNPYLERLHERMEGKLRNYFKQYVNNYKSEFLGKNPRCWDKYPRARMEKADRDFKEFRDVCSSIAGEWLSVSPLRNRPVGKFARLCVNRGKLGSNGFLTAFGQTFRITKVEVRFDHTSLDVDCRCLVLGCQLSSKRWNVNSHSWDVISAPFVFSGVELPRTHFGNGWVTVPTDTVDVLTNPFMLLEIRLYYAERMKDWTSTNGSGSYYGFLDFRRGNSYTEKYYDICLDHWGADTDNAGRLSVRVTWEGIGDDFLSLWDEAQK